MDMVGRPKTLTMNSNSNDKHSASKAGLIRVSKEAPCLHCGKPDWCYLIGNLSVCNRDQQPATGWETTSKTDEDGHYFYAPVQEKKPLRAPATTYYYYPDRDGLPLLRVRRKDFGDGRKKDIKQEHWDKDRNEWVMGAGKVPRANVPIYRYAEIQKVIANGQHIFIVDGESCADALWDLGLAATTSLGGAGKWRITDTSDLQGAKVVICPDRDEPGIKDAAKISEQFPEAQWLYCYPDSWAWDNLPASQGLDVKDWIQSEKIDAQTVLNSLLSFPRTRKNVVYLSSSGNSDDYIPDTAPAPEQSYVQKAREALYSGSDWVAIAGQLLEFTGTYYEVRPEATEKRRILDWLSTYSEFVKGKYRCTRANPASVNEVYAYMLLAVAVDIKEINPPGLNCSNGVLRINSDGSHTFTPSNPDEIFTSVGCEYNPEADLQYGDRLLECLEPDQREIVLRTLAASLCLPLVRLKMSRVKGLLCHGDGSNGKDALRMALVAVLGRGVTGKTLKDFQIYDTGRKFPLAGLEHSRVNWSSENSDATKLDKLQSYKQFVTGDELTIEHKGQGEYPYKPEAIAVANCNVLPSISSDAEAIRSRYCIVSFKKTYVVGADASRGELEADPRFKEDPDFILKKIAPALLNRMLERIPLILKEGIDYRSSHSALRDAQEKSNHLWQFMRDRSYEAGKGERVYAKDAWNDLQDWYIETGTLELEYDRDGKEKRVWNELPGRDTPVKAINQLFARLSELVPNLEKHRHTEGVFELGRTKGDFYYIGLRKDDVEKSDKTASASSAVGTARILPSALLQQNISAEAVLKQAILTQSAAEAAEAVRFHFAAMRDSISHFTNPEKSDESAPPSPPVDTARKSAPPVLHQEVNGGALVEQTILTQSHGGAGGALNPTILEVLNAIAKFTVSDKQKL